MQIQLPSAAEVTHALEIWSGRDPRLVQLLDRYGAPAPALRHYGLVLWEGGNLQAAAQALTGAAALTPQDARVWSDLASVFHGLGNADQALACAEESLGSAMRLVLAISVASGIIIASRNVSCPGISQ